MRRARALRWSAAWLVLPVLALLAWAAAISEAEHFGDYPLIATANAWVGLVVLAPVTAAWGAWDAGRLRAWLHQHWSGPARARALARVLGTGLVLALAVVVAGTVAGSGVPASARAAGVVLTGMTTLVAALTTGAALGMVLPRVAAAPVALAAWYAGLALPISMEDGPLRLTSLPGVVTGCCTPDEQVTAQALLTAGILAAGLALVAVISIRADGRSRGALVLAGGLALIGVLGAALTRGAPPATADRTDPLECRDARSFRICVWPEHRGQQERVAAELAAVATSLRADPVTVPRRWTEAPSVPPGWAALSWSTGVSSVDARGAAVIAVVQAAGCLDERGEAVTSLLRVHAGLPALPGPVAPQVARVRALDPAAQGRWVAAQLRACAA